MDTGSGIHLLLLDIGGVLLTNGWLPAGRRRRGSAWTTRK